MYVSQVNMIYLDNAATSWPKPEIVYQTLARFVREKGGNPGHGSHSLAEAAMQTIDETRILVARFIGAREAERVVFTLNCTDSINMGLKGLLKPGDHVITSSLEHNAVVRPLYKLQERGIKITKIPISRETGTVAAGDLENAITAETRLILMIHASNVNGVIQPIEEYGAIAKKHNLIFMVDAAQTTGHYPLDVRAENIDLLTFSAHKGTFGAPGVGVLYAGPRVNLDTFREGCAGSCGSCETQPDELPERLESGTPNSAGIASLGAGLKYIDEEKLEHVRAHEQRLVNGLIEGLSRIPGVSLFTAGDMQKQAPVISFNIRGYEPREVGTILDKSFDIKVRTGLHCAPDAHQSLGTFPGGTVRLSPGYFNTDKQIEQTVEAINKIARGRRSLSSTYTGNKTDNIISSQ